LKDDRPSLFLMLGQSPQKAVSKLADTVFPETLLLSATEDLALVLPNEVRRAAAAAEVFKLFFVFENFVRGFVLEILSDLGGSTGGIGFRRTFRTRFRSSRNSLPPYG
jgi:hypothetical protein